MSLTFKKLKLLSADFNGESSLPSLANMKNVQTITKSSLDEDDGLFIGYGFVSSIFPYRMQDLYNRELSEKEYLCAVLENKYLRATFLPDFGGRLWSLYDKVAEKDLLYENDVVRPCNLALRNAWISGGIEYNCGMVGHGPFTCSRMFTSRTSLEDGTPVLRMYEFERIRRIVYQMDFFLPEDSKVLYARMRIVNPSCDVTPMYWWTNIATPEGEEYRNVMDAETVFRVSGVDGVYKAPVPYSDDIDVTYPTNTPVARDYFWNIPEGKRKYTSYFDKNGYGFFQTSTSRLVGRKLFVWGQSKFGDRWQEFLTSDGSKRRYVEIQAGLAHTQYECLPMPPKTAWEWMECYGALSADPKKIHGEWKDARTEVSEKLDELVKLEYLEKLLKDTHKMATSPAEQLICSGSGWGKLENIRRSEMGEPLVCPHLDFGNTSSQQSEWEFLLKNGAFKEDGNDLPESWMLQPEWTAMIEKAPDCYKKSLHLAAIYFTQMKIDEAEKCCKKALEYKESPVALFTMAEIYRMKGEDALAADHSLKAYKLCPDNIPLARETMLLNLGAKNHQTMIELYENASVEVKADGRMQMYYCFALLRSGNAEMAEAVLYTDGGICLKDIREGEATLTELCIEIAEAKAKNQGKPYTPSEDDVPYKFAFRTVASIKKN